MLKDIADNGEARLDSYLASAKDRQIIYGRFAAYVPFAEGYSCPLDGSGGLAGDKPVELAPGRTLRFIGLNTALACSTKDEEGRLLIGARQRVLPRSHGEELVVLAHHPMKWLQDGEDASTFIRRRARVLITGHEHNPSVRPESVGDGCDLLTLAAGATVPPSDETLHYTYNIIEFEFDPNSEGLRVTVQPRSWVDNEKDFAADSAPLGGQGPSFTLGCPNFRAAVGQDECSLLEDPAAHQSEPISGPEPIQSAEAEHNRMSDQFALLLLRFFRDLSPGQRVRVLVELKALPDDWSEELSHGIERQVVDGLERTGQLDQLSAAIERVIDSDNKGENQKNG